MRFVGIDPGKLGGIASMAADGSDVKTWTMPETITDLAGLFLQLSIGLEVKTCCLEIVASRPGQSVKAMFTFGQVYGHIEMAIVASGLRLERVRPQEWQKYFGLITGKEVSKTKKKNKHKARAQELWPDIKITHAIADALLICEWIRRQNIRPPGAEPEQNHHTGPSMTKAQIRKRHARIMKGQ